MRSLELGLILLNHKILWWSNLVELFGSRKEQLKRLYLTDGNLLRINGYYIDFIFDFLFSHFMLTIEGVQLQRTWCIILLMVGFWSF
jgi:hypothetical protein